MSISKSYNKQNGVVYVYEVIENYWDKEKKRSQTKRKLIGKIDPETNEIVPTSRKKKSTDNNNPDYKKLYEEALKEMSQKDERLKSLQDKLISTLLDEQSSLVKIEEEITKRRKAVDSLLRKIKNYG